LKKYRRLAEVEVPRLEAIVRMLEEQQHGNFHDEVGVLLDSDI